MQTHGNSTSTNRRMEYNGYIASHLRSAADFGIVGRVCPYDPNGRDYSLTPVRLFVNLSLNQLGERHHG